MNLIALETATSVCSVALFRGGEPCAEASLYRRRAHSEFLVPLIGDVLRYAQLEVSELDVVAVSSGPGSYTGLRIGVSTAKGLAAAVDARLVAVPSLTALADLVRPAAVDGDRIAAAFDARQDEMYAAMYEVDGTSLRVVREAAVLRTENAPDWLESGPSHDRHARGRTYLVGDGWTKMRGRMTAAAVWLPADDCIRPSAVGVGRIGAEKLKRGDVEDLVTFEPYYLKEFVATQPQQTAFEKLSF